MTNFTYNYGIPATNDDPSVDQPNMLINANSIGGDGSALGILDVDHVGFNLNDGGTHKQVTYISNNTPGAQANPTSTAYTGTGVTTAVSENLFKNSLGIFPISAIKAYARFTTAMGPVPPFPATVTATSQINLASNSIGLNVIGTQAQYTFNLKSGTTVSDKMAVFFTFSDYRAITIDQYNYTISANQVFLNIKTTISASATPYIVTMMILQY